MKTLEGTIALVTGASRGIGRGIALELGALGATVYVTGRTTEKGHSKLPGTINETAAAITAAGGHGVAIVCDHADDEQVKALFEEVRTREGHIDILVNNVTSFPPDIISPPPFWTKGLALADQITVGLRSAYTASYFAAPLLLKSRQALIVNISYYGAVSYHLDPAYGATKAGLDKMTSDMAQDFKPYGVTVLSVWPGPTRTEMAEMLISQLEGGHQIMESFETPQFTGRVVAALYQDPNVLSKSGQVVIGAEAAHEYGFKDANGNQPPTLRDHHGSPARFFQKPVAGELSEDEALVRVLIEERAQALRHKSTSESLGTQTDDYIQFGLTGALFYANDEAARAATIQAFANFTGPIDYETKDLNVEVSGDLAVSRSLSRISGTMGDTTFAWWFRKTLAFRKQNGAWKIIHEHESVPMAADGSGRAALGLMPD